VKIRHSPAAVSGYKDDGRPDNRRVQSHEELSPEGVVQGSKPQSQKPGRMPRVNGLLPSAVNGKHSSMPSREGSGDRPPKQFFLAADVPPGCRDAGSFWLTTGSPLSHDSIVNANRHCGC
jgi:hypothetical protein